MLKIVLEFEICNNYDLLHSTEHTIVSFIFLLKIDCHVIFSIGI